ncbi:phenylacetate-CoA oxygenase subunit PaaI [Bacillaceae bacterium SAS-127]|nr:phenylacetate-CoA oxygenase subunit PaaI [Bacillaceae bacterium SAS-127]
MSQDLGIVNSQYNEAVIHLLFQLADDDFLYSYRASEWLGLAPHIEEDVASSSICQDSMGHAAMYYELLENIGAGKADDLAHLRPANERKNSILVERPNGEGFYMSTPKYDWAYAVVRGFFYTQAKKIKIDSLKSSSYIPLAEVSMKVSMELHYHLLHWKTWFIQLLSSSKEASERMIAAIDQTMNDFGDIFSYGAHKETFVEFKLIESEQVLANRWTEQMASVLKTVHLEKLMIPAPRLNGRNGVHTNDLSEAIATLSEVYRMDLTASW